MEVFKRANLNDCRPHRDIDSRTTKPIAMEKLEPRILLSGDVLLDLTPNPIEDTLLDNTPRAIQHSEESSFDSIVSTGDNPTPSKTQSAG